MMYGTSAVTWGELDALLAEEFEGDDEDDD